MTASASLPGATAESALGVAALLSVAKDVLEGAFEPLWVRGEVTSFMPHRNGHWYVSLKDGDATLKCVVWKRDVPRIPAPPAVGDQISAYGRVSFYAARGEMQFSVTAMEAAGEGLWRRRFEMARAFRTWMQSILAPVMSRLVPTS